MLTVCEYICVYYIIFADILVSKINLNISNLPSISSTLIFTYIFYVIYYSATSGPGGCTYPSGTPEFISLFCKIPVPQRLLVFNLKLYLFQEDYKQPEVYKVGVFCFVVLRRSLFVISSLFPWWLYCLSFFYLRLPIVPFIFKLFLSKTTLCSYKLISGIALSITQPLYILLSRVGTFCQLWNW